MSEEKDFFQTCFNTVASLEVKNESQAIAKEAVLSEVETLQQENKQLKDNWNAIKNIIKDIVSVGYTDKHGEYYWPTKENSEYGVRAKILLDKMEEMERINNND